MRCLDDMVTHALFMQPLHSEDHQVLHNHAPATYRSFSGICFSTFDGSGVPLAVAAVEHIVQSAVHVFLCACLSYLKIHSVC